MKKFALIIFPLIFVLVILEGASSITLNLFNTVYAYRNFGIAEGSSTETQFDRDLGWANKPSVVVRDKYGAGKPLTINSQGFRQMEEVPREKREGMKRVVIVGDSFVFGSENGDLDTIPAHLNELLTNAECINLGVPGYGIDQAYLNYLKNGSPLDPDVLLYCVLPADFERASRERFRSGYNKPLIKVRGNKLQITNVPVPPPLPERSSLFTKKDAVIWYIRKMSITELMKKTMRALGMNASPELRGVDYGMNIMPYLLGDLKSRNPSVQVVVVSLPMQFDYSQGKLSGDAKSFNARLANICQNAEVEFYDISDVFLPFSDTELKRYFHADWHYNELGVRLIAEEMSRRIESLRQIDI